MCLWWHHQLGTAEGRGGRSFSVLQVCHQGAKEAWDSTQNFGQRDIFSGSLPWLPVWFWFFPSPLTPRTNPASGNKTRRGPGRSRSRDTFRPLGPRCVFVFVLRPSLPGTVPSGPAAPLKAKTKTLRGGGGGPALGSCTCSTRIRPDLECGFTSRRSRRCGTPTASVMADPLPRGPTTPLPPTPPPPVAGAAASPLGRLCLSLPKQPWLMRPWTHPLLPLDLQLSKQAAPLFHSATAVVLDLRWADRGNPPADRRR